MKPISRARLPGRFASTVAPRMAAGTCDLVQNGGVLHRSPGHPIELGAKVAHFRTTEGFG